jgi:hypothetical protein
MFTHHIVSYVADCRRDSERIRLAIEDLLGEINEWCKTDVREEDGDRGWNGDAEGEGSSRRNILSKDKLELSGSVSLV